MAEQPKARTDEALQLQRLRSMRQIESATEQRIREAIEGGAFDNLATKGKPIRLDLKDAYDRDAWFVNRTMKNFGAVPLWIELGKQIDADDERLRRLAADFARWLDELRRELQPLGPRERARRRPGIELRFEDRLARYRALAEQLRREIDRFNLEVPARSLEKPGVWVAHELRRLQEPYEQLCQELGWDAPSPDAPTTEPVIVPPPEVAPESPGRHRLLELWRRAGRR